MNIRDVGKTTVVDIAGNAISEDVLGKLRNLLKEKISANRIAINLKNVKFITHEFIELIKDNENAGKISLFGLNNDVYLLLFVSRADKYVDIYLDETDFCKEKNAIVYRRFKLLKSA